MTVALVFEVDWNNDHVFGGVNETITAFVKKMSIRRGRSGLSGAASPGSCTLVLDNDDRRFSPDNVGGPLFGNLKGKRDFRVRTTAPIATTLFTGAVDSIVPEATLDRKTAVLEAKDLSLASIRERGAIWTLMQTNSSPSLAAASVLDEIGWPVLNREISAGTTVMDTWWASGQDPLTAIAELCDEDHGFFFIKRDGKAHFEGRAFRASGVAAAPSVTYTDRHPATPPAATFQYDDIGYMDGLENIVNSARASSQSRLVPLFYKTLWTLKETPLLTPGQTRDFDATWENPSNDLSFTGANRQASTQQPGNGDMTAFFSWTLMNQRATRATIRVTNNHTVLSGFITLLNLDVKAREVNGRPVEQAADDSTSQADFGVRRVAYSPRYLGNYNEALAWCQYIVFQRSQPTPLISLTLKPYTSLGEASAVSHEMSDLVLVQNDELQLDHKHWVEAVEHEVTGPGGLWTTRLVLSRVVGAKSYWQLETAGFGELEQTTRFFG